MNAVGTNTAQSTSAVAMIGPVTSRIALLRGFDRREAARDVALDVFDHDDRVVDHDADREHEAEQRQRVEREAEQRASRRSVPTSDTGTAASGMIDARQVCRNRMTTSTTSSERLEQRVHDGFDRLAHEDRRVVDDLVVEPCGKFFFELAPSSPRTSSEISIAFAPGRLEDGERDGRLVVEQRAQRVAARAEFDAGDVAQPRDLAVSPDLHDDVAELLLGDEAALAR